MAIPLHIGITESGPVAVEMTADRPARKPDNIDLVVHSEFVSTKSAPMDL
jgi:hypothetical protein